MAIEVGPLVRRLRERYRMTQQDLVEYTGLDRSASYISSIETGRTSPTLAELEALARVFRTTVVEMIQETAGGDGPTERWGGTAERSEVGRATGRDGDGASAGEPVRNVEAIVGSMSEAGRVLALELLEILVERDRRR